MAYDAIYRGRNKSRNKSRDHSQSNGQMCTYCGKSHNRGNCPAFGKNAKSVAETTILKPCVRVVTLETQVDQGQRRKATKGTNFMRSLKTKMVQWMI